MRLILTLVIVAACSKGSSSKEQGSAAPPAAATASAPTQAKATLATQNIRLLETEDVISQRLPDVDAFSDLLKSVGSAVIAYDVTHPLPDELYVAVVARATGTRVWVTTPKGDVPTPGLDEDIAKLRKAPVKDGNVAAVIALLRTGASATTTDPVIPAAWKAAAPKGGASIDDVIDRVWPR
jgi:hypothetical protein